MSVFLLQIAFPFITAITQLGGEPKVLVQEGQYEKIALTDSTTLEVYASDSIWVVMTACAPQCSSCARVYNKEGKLLRSIEPPIQTIFPLARIDPTTGKLIWKDNDNWEY